MWGWNYRTTLGIDLSRIWSKSAFYPSDGKLGICIENAKIKNQKTSRESKLTSEKTDVFENAKSVSIFDIPSYPFLKCFFRKI